MMHGWGWGWGYGYGPILGPISMLVMAVLLVIPFWRICRKAGYPGFAGLLILVPLVNLIFLYWLAFTDWPNLRETNRPPPA